MRSIEEIDQLFDYHQPTPDQVSYMKYTTGTLKNLAKSLFRDLNGSAEVTVAIRKLHEARMQVNCAVVNSGLSPSFSIDTVVQKDADTGERSGRDRYASVPSSVKEQFCKVVAHLGGEPFTVQDDGEWALVGVNWPAPASQNKTGV